jgi:energy-coupling factor transporter ATP-binding protein EcfA2
VGRGWSAPNGIVLVTGPTGSGKTTTLYSTLKRLATPEVNVCTIEDPIEMIEPEFNQMQVQHNIDLGFASGVRTLLRQDPDIIMVGEIRDLETAEMAIQAALTGHLVLSTLHTNDAPGPAPVTTCCACSSAWACRPTCHPWRARATHDAAVMARQRTWCASRPRSARTASRARPGYCTPGKLSTYLIVKSGKESTNWILKSGKLSTICHFPGSSGNDSTTSTCRSANELTTLTL